MPYILFTRRPFCYWSLLQWSLIRDPLFPRNHSRPLYELILFRHLYTSCVIFHSEILAAFRFERTLCAVTRYWLSYPEPWWSCSPVASGDETQSMFERRVNCCQHGSGFAFASNSIFNTYFEKIEMLVIYCKEKESIRKSTELNLILLNLGSIKHGWIHWSNTKGKLDNRKVLNSRKRTTRVKFCNLRLIYGHILFFSAGASCQFEFSSKKVTLLASLRLEISQNTY